MFKDKSIQGTAVQILAFGSEILTPRKTIKKKTDVDGNKFFFSRTAGTPFFGHKRNEVILEELKVEPVDDILRR